LQGFKRLGWVMSVTQQVSLDRSCVICTIYSHRPKRVIGKCRVLSRVSWKIVFTSENYAQQPTQVVVPWEHLSYRVRSSFPEQGVTCHIFLHSVEVCPSKRDQNLAAQLGVHSCPHFHGVGPSHWSKPITAFSTQRMLTQFTQAGCTPDIHPQQWST
jgi:hypothetical protein